MKKLLITIFLFILLSVIVFSQEATKVGEFGYLPCDQFNDVMSSFYLANEGDIKYTDSKIAIIYYGAKHIKTTTPNFYKGDSTKNVSPIRDDSRNRALDISLYLVLNYRFPKARIELIDGGFREDFEFELWIVPRNAKNPQPTARVDEKTVTYIEGEPTKIRNCSGIIVGKKKDSYTEDDIQDDTKAVLIDEFGRIHCGDFLARMDALYIELDRNPNSTIAIVYYGRRYWKESFGWNKETKEYEKIRLNYAHRDDGLNWAKAIPLYLIESERYPKRFRYKQKKTLKLINGGYLENIMVRIWLVPKGGKTPKPTFQAFKEKDVKLLAKKAIRTPIMANCYSGH